MDLSGKKVLICEEALADYNGHFFTWINAIRQMHLDAGAEVFVAGNREVVPEVKDALQVRPVYSVNSWAMQSESGKWPAWRRYMHVFVHNWKVFRETASALRQTGPVDIVLFTAVRIHHLIGLRLLCTWGLGRMFKRLVVFLPQSQAEYNADYTEFHFKPSAKLIRGQIRSFRRLVKNGRVVLACDSHITGREYEALAGVPFTLFPSPGGALKYPECDEKKPDHGPVFSILGVSAFHKGIDVFQDAILSFLKKFPDTRAKFILQWGAPVTDPEGRRIEISPALRAAPQVSLYEERLSSEDYSRLFAQTDIVVLPYRKMTYFNRLSGVAVEAACSGKPMIVTEGTWLAWAVKEFGAGVEVPEDSVESLGQALEYCCNHFGDLMQVAAGQVCNALNYNSPNRYLDVLWLPMPPKATA